MKDKDSLLARIGHMEGQVVTRDIARACREHVGDVGEGSPALELIKRFSVDYVPKAAWR